MNRNFIAVLFIIGMLLLLEWLPVKSAHAEDDIDSNPLFRLSLEELMDVTVFTASKTPETVSEIPASVVVITRSTIQDHGYTALSEILNDIPGYYMLGNLGIDVCGVRGFTKGSRDNNFVFLLNGNRITDERILAFYQIPVYAIDRIEVVRGPMSVIYGNNAFFGAIDIITNDATSTIDEPHFLTASYGSYNSREGFLRLSSSDNNSSFVINTSYQISDGPDYSLSAMMTRPEVMDEPLFEGEDGRGLNLPQSARTTDDYLGSHQLYLDVSMEHGPFTFTANVVESYRGWYYYYPSVSDGSYFLNRTAVGSLQHRFSISDKVRMSNRIRFQHVYAYYDYNHLFEDFYGWDRFDFQEIIAESNVYIEPSDPLRITLGAEYENVIRYINDTNVPIANLDNCTFYYVDDDDIAVTLSAFAQADLEITPNLKSVVGFRLEQSLPYDIRIARHQGSPPPEPPDPMDNEYTTTKERGDLIAIPRVALLYKIATNHHLKLMYGYAARRPGFSTIGEDANDIHDGIINGYSSYEYIQTREIYYLSLLTSGLVMM